MPNGIGTIDYDYRGELMVLATWIGEGDEFTVQKGERVAQLLFSKVQRSTLLSNKIRGIR